KASITLTGHSLGGLVAQLIGNASGFNTVTFNAPGGGKLRAALQSELSEVTCDSSPSDGSNISNIRVSGDVVSLLGMQIGPVATLNDPLFDRLVAKVGYSLALWVGFVPLNSIVPVQALLPLTAEEPGFDGEDPGSFSPAIGGTLLSGISGALRILYPLVP